MYNLLAESMPKGVWVVPLTRLYYHVTWAVKGRTPLLEPAWEARVYNVIIKKVESLGGRVHAIGGVEDHIHVLFSLPPKVSLSECIAQMKGSSSHFINHVIQPDIHFAWQREYGAFTVSEQDVRRLVQYIRQQRIHHSQNSIIRQWENL